MRPTEVVNIPNIKSFLYIFILTTKINSIMRSFFLIKKNDEIQNMSKIRLSVVVILNYFGSCHTE